MEYIFAITASTAFIAMIYVAKKSQHGMEALQKARGWRPMSDY